MGILKIKGLDLELNGSKILDDLSVDFLEGHVHAVIGPNGAGKSTLAQTIMGLPEYKKAKGSIIFDGEEIINMPIDQRAKLGITLAWQEPARFEGISVKDFILASARNKNDSVVEECLNAVGLAPSRYSSRFVDKSLSGGERKRIELASILAMRPKLVLMDEPDSGVDIDALEYVFNIIKKLKEVNTTVILITHSPHILKQSDHAFLVCHGRLMDKGDSQKMQNYFEGHCMPCTHKNLPDFDKVFN